MELNAFEPVVFYSLFDSIDTLKEAVETLTKNCIHGITANEAHCRSLVDKSVGISTAVCPYLGYKESPTSQDSTPGEQECKRNRSGTETDERSRFRACVESGNDDRSTF